MGVTTDAIRAVAFLWRAVDGIGIVVIPVRIVALRPKWHAPMAGDISLLESVDVRIADESGVTVVGVPIGTGEYVLERAMGVLKDGGVDRHARCLPRMPDKQVAALIAIESLEKRTSYPEKAMDTELSLQACRRENNGPQ